jgi:ADP-heptose:LPS heptosyltransferase
MEDAVNKKLDAIIGADTSRWSRDNRKSREILLIHLGGLGDMCLSESTFLSLSLHFHKNIVAVGYKRFLNLFNEYFAGVHSIESRNWLYLFSKIPSDTTWEGIVFIGKDRAGRLRKRLQRLSKEPLIFIDMYPENSGEFRGQGFEGSSGFKTLEPLNPRTPGQELQQRLSRAGLEPFHVEDYQLMQLGQYGIQAIKKEIQPRLSKRVILYPEIGFKKAKWHHENFIKLYWLLQSKNVDVYILEPLSIKLEFKEKISFQELPDIRDFFKGGGIFVSNDSGMAHLAGICGLFTITLFTDYDPEIWHPRGHYKTLQQGLDRIDIETVLAEIEGVLNSQ